MQFTLDFDVISGWFSSLSTLTQVITIIGLWYFGAAALVQICADKSVARVDKVLVWLTSPLAFVVAFLVTGVGMGLFLGTCGIVPPPWKWAKPQEQKGPSQDGNV